jgi:hypothetical protein
MSPARGAEQAKTPARTAFGRLGAGLAQSTDRLGDDLAASGAAFAWAASALSPALGRAVARAAAAGGASVSRLGRAVAGAVGRLRAPPRATTGTPLDGRVRSLRLSLRR